jgi:hypothetical protein
MEYLKYVIAIRSILNVPLQFTFSKWCEFKFQRNTLNFPNTDLRVNPQYISESRKN